MYSRLAATFLILVFSLSCDTRNLSFRSGIYYWKTEQRSLTEGEVEILEKSKPDKLYVHFFDVKVDDVFGAIPESKQELYRFPNQFNSIPLVPVVYIRNDVFKSLKSKASLNLLASNIDFLIKKYVSEKFANYKISEFQIDCDWTATTKNNYFSFLRLLRAKSGKVISATLRLYPYKYRHSMGIPHVDTVNLMCYNLLPPLDSPQKNSILDLNELEAYVRDVPTYPKPLNIILPAFQWIHIYHNKQFVGTSKLDISHFTGWVKQVDKLWYEATSDFMMESYFVKDGDKLKFETVSPEVANRALKLLTKHLSLGTNVEIGVYHLDDTQITPSEREKIPLYHTLQ